MNGNRIVIIALILTVLVFLAGMFLGVTFDSYKSNTVSNEIKQNELKLEGYITEQQFIEALGENRCDVLASRVADIRTATRALGRRLGQFGASTAFKIEDFHYLKQKYFISEVKFYSIILDLNNNCNQNYETILYFYKVGDLNSVNQGYVLDALDLATNYSVTILSFDIDYTREPLIDMLLKKYNITSAPAMVINNKFIKQGFMNREEILEILSEHT